MKFSCYYIVSYLLKQEFWWPFHFRSVVAFFYKIPILEYVAYWIWPTVPLGVVHMLCPIGLFTTYNDRLKESEEQLTAVAEEHGSNVAELVDLVKESGETQKEILVRIITCMTPTSSSPSYFIFGSAFRTHFVLSRCDGCPCKDLFVYLHRTAALY